MSKNGEFGKKTQRILGVNKGENENYGNHILYGIHSSS
jgi:hypothetical protein